MNKTKYNLVDRVFGRLRVIERFGTDGCKRATWKCVCDCGKPKIVSTRDLINGCTKSCGCLFRDTLVQLHINNRKENCGYAGVHRRIRRKYGLADKCENCNVKSKTYEWANLDHFYSEEMSTWMKLCKSCHVKYDYSFNYLFRVLCRSMLTKSKSGVSRLNSMAR